MSSFISVMKRVFIFILMLLLSFPAFAEEPVKGFRDTDLPLPRFVSLKSDRVYVRAGPAMRYPIKWVYKRGGAPVEIVQEFEAWRKIRDVEGEEGWVHQTLLSGSRAALVQGEDIVLMRDKPDEKARLVARLEPEVVARIEKCDKDWCKLDAAGFRGWVERKSIWGIYDKEVLN